MQDTDKAWAAGFFDGEGYVTIGRSRSISNGKTYEGTYLRLGINHVNPKPLHKIVSLFGGTLRTNRSSTAKDGCNRKPRCEWIIHEKDSKVFIDTVFPYIINKTDALLIANEYLQTRTKSTKKLDSSVKELRLNLKEKLKELNGRD